MLFVVRNRVGDQQRSKDSVSGPYKLLTIWWALRSPNDCPHLGRRGCPFFFFDTLQKENNITTSDMGNIKHIYKIFGSIGG